jgi:hypothetical protein
MFQFPKLLRQQKVNMYYRVLLEANYEYTPLSRY